MATETTASSKKSPFFMVALVIYALVLVYTTWMALTQPVRNWDMMGYMGAVVAMDTGNNHKQIHDRVMAEIKPVVWPELYEEFSKKNDLSADPEKFYNQLRFYSIKPLYVQTIKFLNHAGVGLARATWLISCISFIILMGLLAAWKPEHGSRGIWLLSVAAFTLFGHLPLGALAGYSTPDAMSVMFIFLGFTLWVRKHSLLGYVIATTLAVFARPDSIIPVLALTAFFTLFAAPERRMKYMQTACAVVPIIASYIIIHSMHDSADWSTLFYHAFINDHYDFSKPLPAITAEQYQLALVDGVTNQFMRIRMIIVTALSVIAVVCSLKQPNKEWLWFLGMAWGTFAVRFALFPNWGDERYYYYYYLLIIMASLELITPMVTSYKLVQKN